MMSAEACLGEQGPDTKVLISYLAFLCARLLDVSKEERAAFRLQQLWKRRRTLLPGQSLRGRGGGRGGAREGRVAFEMAATSLGCQTSFERRSRQGSTLGIRGCKSRMVAHRSNQEVRAAPTYIYFISSSLLTVR